MSSHAICPFCAVGCGLAADSPLRGRVAFRGDPTHPVNHGALCARGAAATFEAGSRERLLMPLRRGPGESRWSPVSWDEALAIVSRQLLDTRARTWDASRAAAAGIGFFGGATAMNEEVWLFVRLARLLGILDLDHQGRSCHAASTAALGATLGMPAATHDWSDLPDARWILVLGSNPSDAHPIAARWLHAARARGAAVAVVDPRVSRTARGADRHLPIRPGTDLALLCGLIGRVLADGAEDREWLRRFTDAGMGVLPEAEIRDGLFGGWRADERRYDSSVWGHPGEVGLDDPRSVLSAMRRHFGRYDAATVAAITGVAEEDVRALGDLLVARRRGAVLFSMGVTQQVSGVAAVRAAAILQALLGNLEGPGGGLFPMKGHANIQGATDLGGLFAHLPGYLPAPTVREGSLEDYAARYGEAPASHLVALLRAWFPEGEAEYGRLPRREEGAHHSMQAALRADRLEVMLLLGQNPVHGSGNPRFVARALSRLRLLVCIDPFLNETSRFWERLPDCGTEVLALPAAAFSEKPGSRTNACRRVQWQEACETPRGESRPDAWIIDAIYRRMQDVLGEVHWPDSGNLYDSVNDEIARACWLYRGMARRVEGWHWPGGQSRLLDGFAGGRVRLWAGPSEWGGWRHDAVPDGPLPEYYALPGSSENPLHNCNGHPLLPLDAGDGDFPLILSTTMTENDNRRCAPPRGTRNSLEVRVPRFLAERLSLEDGARVWLETAARRAAGIMRVIDADDRGVVWAPSYWSGEADDERFEAWVDPGDPHTLLDDVRLVPCRIRER